jgi:hypothetical protein
MTVQMCTNRACNADGAGRFVRFTLSPEKGEHSLPVEQRATADPHYLMKGVFDELPIRYRVIAQLAHDDDQTTDPSKAWPADRERVDVGVVVITGPDTERERDGDILVNDPMPDGRDRAVGRPDPAHPYLRLRGVGARSHRRRTAHHSVGGAAPTYMASTLGMISSFRRLRSSSVLDTGTSANGGQSSGIVSPASL